MRSGFLAEEVGMAAPFSVLESVGPNGTAIARGTLALGTAALSDGVWVKTHRQAPLHVTVEPSADWDGTVEIRGSLADPNGDPPLNTLHGTLVNDAVSGGPADVTVPSVYHWIKVRVTIYTAGSINAYFSSGGMAS